MYGMPQSYPRFRVLPAFFVRRFGRTFNRDSDHGVAPAL